MWHQVHSRVPQQQEHRLLRSRRPPPASDPQETSVDPPDDAADAGCEAGEREQIQSAKKKIKVFLFILYFFIKFYNLLQIEDGRKIRRVAGLETVRRVL